MTWQSTDQIMDCILALKLLGTLVRVTELSLDLKPVVVLEVLQEFLVEHFHLMSVML